VSGKREVTIRLTDGQVRQVVREASGHTSLASVLPEVGGLEALRGVVLSLKDDTTCSRSTLRGLLVLAAFPVDGSERELSDVARQLGLSPSTTHRYIGTWMAVGMLEQDPRSRRYRRVPASRPGGGGATVAAGGGGRDAG
jgi:hypothetical protein